MTVMAILALLASWISGMLAGMQLRQYNVVQELRGGQTASAAQRRFMAYFFPSLGFLLLSIISFLYG